MPASGQVKRFIVDNDQSSFTFTVAHLGMLDVVGELSGASGYIDVEMETGIPAETRVSLNATTLSTDNSSRDETIHSDEFLDTGRYPAIEFTSTEFSLQYEPTLADSGYSGEGELTIAGTTKPISFLYALEPATTADGRNTITVSSTFLLSRENFRLEFGRIMDAMVGDEVAVTVVLTAVLMD